MKKELKLPKTYDEQIAILKSKGLTISNEQQAIEILSDANYYRIINAYSIGLIHNDIYDKNVSFDQIYELYSFDGRFRYLLSEVIEKIEVMMRTKIAYHLAMTYCSTAYLRKDIFDSEEKFDIFLREFNKEVSRQAQTAIIAHHQVTYDGILPIWVAVEFFSFGMLSMFFKNLKAKDKSEICKDLPYRASNVNYSYVQNWLHALVDVRNICAHYGRLYNRNLASPPKLFRENNYIRNNRIFAVLLVAKRLIPDTSIWNTFVSSIQTLFGQYPSVNLKWIGFPDGWEDMLHIK